MLQIQFGPQSRIHLLQELVNRHRYKTYLEIGCDSNFVFDQIKVEQKEGVDPTRGGTVRKTSDEFFASDNRKFDLIFIDGLHEYQQVSRDVKNALDRLNDNGTIVIHDMLPTFEEQALPVWTVAEWLGDVWRLGFSLAQNPDVKFNILTIDYGCGVLTKGTQTPIEIKRKSGTWDFYEKNWKKLPLISYEQFFA